MFSSIKPQITIQMNLLFVNQVQFSTRPFQSTTGNALLERKQKSSKQTLACNQTCVSKMFVESYTPQFIYIQAIHHIVTSSNTDFSFLTLCEIQYNSQTKRPQIIHITTYNPDHASHQTHRLKLSMFQLGM